MSNLKSFFATKRNITIVVSLCVILVIVTTYIAVMRKNNKPKFMKISANKIELKKEQDKKAVTDVAIENNNKKDDNKKNTDKKTQSVSNESDADKPKKQLPTVKRNKVTKSVNKAKINKVKKIEPKSNSNIAKKLPKKTVKKNTNIIKPKPTIFTSEKLGFTITFPASWENKYTLQETKDGIAVFYKLKNKIYLNEGFLFAIKNKEKLEFKFEDTYDSIGSFKEFKAKGITYVIGGPLDYPIGEEQPKSERDTYSNMMNERYDALNTLKRIN